MHDAAPANPGKRSAALVSVAILVGALALRLALAAQRSLWLDEFHSLFHAQQASLSQLLASVARDNHPPLSFLLERASIALFGDGELALRAPSIAAGVAHVALIGHAARRWMGSTSAWIAMALVAASSLCVSVAAEGRMYALLALAVTGWLDSLGSASTNPRSRWLAGAWCWIGFHTHYAFLHYVAVTLAAASATREGRTRLRACAPGLAVAALASTPWALWGFGPQLFASDLAPGGMQPSWARLAESYVHMQFHLLSTPGDPWRFVFLAIAALGLALAARASILWLRSRSAQDEPRCEWIAAAWLTPAWCALAALVFRRSGFNWTYLAPSAAPFALLIALGTQHATLARAASTIVIAASATLSAIVARSPGMEDYRTAVESLLSRVQAGDVLIVAEAGPELFPRSLGFAYYARKRADEDAPQPLEVSADYRIVDDAALHSAHAVWVFGRGVGQGAPLYERLRPGFVRVASERLGWSLTLERFERAP